MKLHAIGMLLTLAVTSGPALAEQSPDIFQITKSFRLEFGEDSAGVIVTTAPPNKRMVIQTIGLLRYSTGNIGTVQGILNTSIFGNASAFPMPSVDAPLRGITTPVTIYGGAGQPVSFSVSRSGNLMGGETEFVTITGYYVDKP